MAQQGTNEQAGPPRRLTAPTEPKELITVIALDPGQARVALDALAVASQHYEHDAQICPDADADGGVCENCAINLAAVDRYRGLVEYMMPATP